MTTMTHRSASVLSFGLAAGALVAMVHGELDPLSVSGGFAAATASVFIAAYCYTRFCARQAGSAHALGVGIAWLLFAIAAEMAMTAHLGRGWHALIGTPDRPLLRNVFLFVWIFAPAFFASREAGA